MENLLKKGKDLGKEEAWCEVWIWLGDVYDQNKKWKESPEILEILKDLYQHAKDKYFVIHDKNKKKVW